MALDEQAQSLPGGEKVTNLAQRPPNSYGPAPTTRGVMTSIA
jgi:hypothetical protein